MLAYITSAHGLAGCAAVHHPPISLSTTVPLIILRHPPSACLPNAHCPQLSTHLPSTMASISATLTLIVHCCPCCCQWPILSPQSPLALPLSPTYTSHCWGDNIYISFYRIFIIRSSLECIGNVPFILFIYSKYNRELENRQLVGIKLFLKNNNNGCVHRGRQWVGKWVAGEQASSPAMDKLVAWQQAGSRPGQVIGWASGQVTRWVSRWACRPTGSAVCGPSIYGHDHCTCSYDPGPPYPRMPSMFHWTC